MLGSAIADTVADDEEHSTSVFRPGRSWRSSGSCRNPLLQLAVALREHRRSMAGITRRYIRRLAISTGCSRAGGSSARPAAMSS
jgi:hypothetical protein